jgi:O-antigen ligase
MTWIFKNALIQKLNLLCILIFLPILPYDNRYITYLILLWLLFSAVLVIQAKVTFREIIGTEMIFLQFYIISLISLTYSAELYRGILILETQSAIIVMPLLALALRKSIKRDWKVYIERAYLTGLLIYIIICIYIYIKHGNISRTINFLKENSLANTMEYFELSYFQYRSYISMYLLWGIVLIINRLKVDIRSGEKLWLTFAGIIFLLFILVLGSGAAIVTAVVVALFYFISSPGRSLLFRSLIVVLLLIILSTCIFKFIRTGDTSGLSGKAVALKADIRLNLWSDAFHAFTGAPVFGYGIGDAEAHLTAIHRSNPLIDELHSRSNAHNQYLETSLQTGIVGLISLIVMFLVPLIDSVRKGNRLLFILLIIIGINLLFESMLMRLPGVLFISFWMSYLVSNQEEPYIKTIA